MPVGEAVPGTDWGTWIFLQAHVGVFGGHRLTEQTMAILKRSVWWPSMRKDVASWAKTRLTCQRFRKRPTKQETLGARRPD
eukprot:6791747-Alexandrium_andersonii.AAC.1